MSDLKFAMIFEVRGMDAAAAEMKRMREMTGASHTDPGKKAAETARREAEAVKETARNRTIANEQARIESARTERDIRRRAALERAASEEARRGRVREVTAAREQIRVDETRRANEAKAAREARLRELAAKRELQRQDNLRAAAQRNAETERARMEERVAASIARRTGRNVQDIIAEQRAAGQAAEQAAQQATRAESRWRRLGQTMRNATRGVRWGRVAGEASAEIGKQIAKSVAEGMMKGVRDGASGARGLMDRATGGHGARGAARAGAGVGWGLITEGWSRNQQGMDAENAMRGVLGAEKARVARAEAEAASKNSGNLIPLDQSYAAARALSEGGLVADQKLLKLLGDNAVAGSEDVASLARDYERALRQISLEFAAQRGATVTTGEDGSQTLSYANNGESVERRVTAGDRAGTEAALREFLARNEGAAGRKLATPGGVREAGLNTIKANAADALEEPFRVATEWMQRINEMIGGADGGGAKRFGQQIAEGMREAEASIISIATSIREMMGPVDHVVQAFGGWKVAIGGLVALNVVGWLGGAATGIGMLAGAVSALSFNPVVAGAAGLAAAGYLIYRNWDGISDVFNRGWAAIKGGAESAWSGTTAAIEAGIAGTRTAVSNAMTGVLDAARASWDGFTGLFDLERIRAAAAPIIGVVDEWGRMLSGAFDRAFTAVGNVVTRVTEPIFNVIDRIATGIGKVTTWAFGDDKSKQDLAAAEKQRSDLAAGEKAREALAIIGQVPPAARAMVAEVDAILAAADFTSRGIAMMTTLAAGIRAGSAAAVGATREVTQQIRDHLPHSPAKVGPLSDLDRVKFSETLASAIRPEAAIRAVRGMVAGMRGAIPDTLLASGLGVPAQAGFGASPALAKAAGGASPELDEALRQATLAAALGPDTGERVGRKGKREVPSVASRAGPQNNLSVSYAPNVTFNGGEIGDFWSQLESHKDSLVGMIQGSFSRSADLSFG